MTELTLPCGDHLATEKVGDELHSVTDPQDRHAKLKNRWGQLGSTLRIDRGRATRENQPRNLTSFIFIWWLTKGPNLTVDVLLTDSPSDQLGVLGAEVQDQNLAALVHWVHSEGRDSTVHP